MNPNNLRPRNLSFTFHNVSINSGSNEEYAAYVEYLHSIMYLLIQQSNKQQGRGLHDLHSIMYLLIPHSPFSYIPQLDIFTFHNVSINSCTKNLLIRAIQIYIP